VAVIPDKPYAITTGITNISGIVNMAYVGPNSSEDAVITYYLKQRLNSGNVTFQIYDDKGNFVVDFPGTKRKRIKHHYLEHAYETSADS